MFIDLNTQYLGHKSAPPKRFMESMQIQSKSQREFITVFNKMINKIYKEVQTVKNITKTFMKNKRDLPYQRLRLIVKL